MMPCRCLRITHQGCQMHGLRKLFGIASLLLTGHHGPATHPAPHSPRLPWRDALGNQAIKKHVVALFSG